MNSTYISVSGFSASGSSAAVDLIREYKRVYYCDAEVRLIWDPYAISQLERTLTEDWNMVTSSAAISDFLWFCERCARTGGGSNPFSRVGLSYSRTINPNFMEITHEFVKGISDYEYLSDTYHQKFKKSYVRYVFDRCALGVEQKTGFPIYSKTGSSRKCYFSHPTKERFERETKIYFDRLFEHTAKDCDYILLDQAVSVNDPSAISRYFRKGKLIVVDRDPRDMFVDDIVNWSSTKVDEYNSCEAGQHYVKRHLAMHEKLMETDDIIIVRFEDLVGNYDVTKKRIEQFLNMPDEAHIEPKKYLLPEKSSKNIGIWKKHYNSFSKAIDVITNELHDYCY